MNLKTLILLGLIGSLVFCQAQKPLETDAPENTGEAAQDSADEDMFKDLTEEQKSQIVRAQQMKMTSCILYTKIYLNNEIDVFKKLVDSCTDDRKMKCQHKALSMLMSHCFEFASQEDVAKILDNADKQIYTLDGQVKLLDIDISVIGFPDADLQLNEQEQQLLDILRDYEKRAEEERAKMEEEKDLETPNSSEESDRRKKRRQKRSQQNSQTGQSDSGFFSFLDPKNFGIGYLLTVILGLSALVRFLYQRMASNQQLDITKKNKDKVRKRKQKRENRKNKETKKNK